MARLSALVLAALALALLAVAPLLASAETVQLSAGTNTTVELSVGANYTAQAPVVVLFAQPVNVTLYTESGAVTLANALNVTLAPGVELSVAENITAIIQPVEESVEMSAETPLASACIQPSRPTDVARMGVEGPARIQVEFRGNGYRFYIVTLDDDPSKWSPIWYRSDKRYQKPPTLAFGAVSGSKTVTAEVPGGQHTVYAAVSVWPSMASIEKWTICINVVSDQKPPDIYRPPEQPGKPVYTNTPPPSTTTVEMHRVNVDWKLAVIGAGALLLLGALVFLSRK